uniref:Uncharacterized protein n=1 Tax=Rhizophora mucronata TaxID=61149 RepID=A0A2P2QU32_RHIMU
MFLKAHALIRNCTKFYVHHAASICQSTWSRKNIIPNQP